MSCPMNDIRDFKNNRKATTNNVEQLHRSTPLHHARVDEAAIEVTLEPVTCEDATMTTDNTNSIEQPLAPVADAVKDALNTTANTETTSEEHTMADNNAQTETISITSVTERYGKLRRNLIVGTVLGNAAWAAGVVAGAALNGRDVKRAAVVGGVLAAASAVAVTVSENQKAVAMSQAELLDEPVYQAVSKTSVKSRIFGACASLTFGAVAGALLVRKVAAAVTDE